MLEWTVIDVLCKTNDEGKLANDGGSMWFVILVFHHHVTWIFVVGKDQKCPWHMLILTSLQNGQNCYMIDLQYTDMSRMPWCNISRELSGHPSFFWNCFTVSVLGSEGCSVHSTHQLLWGTQGRELMFGWVKVQRWLK